MINRRPAGRPASRAARPLAAPAALLRAAGAGGRRRQSAPAPITDLDLTIAWPSQWTLAGADAPWLELEVLPSGAGGYDIILVADAAGLTPGTYETWVAAITPSCQGRVAAHGVSRAARTEEA